MMKYQCLIVKPSFGSPAGINKVDPICLKDSRAVSAIVRQDLDARYVVYAGKFSQNMAVIKPYFKGTALSCGCNDGPLTVRDPSPIRDFLWIEDAARGLADMAVGTGLGIFNLGSGTGVSVGDLARLALDLAGQSDRPVVASQPSQRPSSLSLNISSTASTFGWAPQVPLSHGLAQLQESRP